MYCQGYIKPALTDELGRSDRGLRAYQRQTGVVREHRRASRLRTRHGKLRIDRTRTIRAIRVDIATLTGAKKRRYRVVSEPRETEGKEKGEGSLSILIVPVERWPIRSRKAIK